MDKKEVLQHLNQMVEDYEDYIIPAQDNKEAKDLLKYDKKVLQKAIKYINKNKEKE